MDCSVSIHVFTIQAIHKIISYLIKVMIKSLKNMMKLSFWFNQNYQKVKMLNLFLK